MNKEFYDKYGKEFHCADCKYLEHCIKSEEPLLNSCREEFLSCKVSDLEAKLAEKEKENELMAKTLKMTKFIEKEVNQEKISFCIDKLEKVKDYAQHIQGGLINYIDNQIKQLKEME